jgi:hypothetical protein
LIPTFQPCALQAATQEDWKGWSQRIVDAACKSFYTGLLFLFDVPFEPQIVGDLCRVEGKNAGGILDANLLKRVWKQIRGSFTSMKGGVSITDKPWAKGEVAGAFTMGLSSSKDKVCKGIRASIVVEERLVHWKRESRDKTVSYQLSHVAVKQLADACEERIGKMGQRLSR